MLEFEFIRLIPEYIRQYRGFPLPVIICNREFSICWSNEAAKALYPSTVEQDRLADLFAEYDVAGLFSELEEIGNCTIADVIPFGGADVSMLPVLSDGKTVGAVLLFLALAARPSSGRAYRSSKTAVSLNTSVRDYINDIFSFMDTASYKADLLHAGWIKTCFNQIGKGGYRVLRISENIAEYAQFHSGTPELSLQTISLSFMLNESRDAILEFGGALDIPVSFDISPEPCAVTADRSRLELAIFNIIHNSMYFTRPGNSIDISLKPEADMIALTISDNGIGIPEDVLPHVWKPYYKFGQVKGVGLGLTVAKMVAEAHRAKIEISSVIGEGTSVTLRLITAPPSAPISLGRDNSRSIVNERFSRLYTGLADAVDSPYHE